MLSRFLFYIILLLCATQQCGFCQGREGVPDYTDKRALMNPNIRADSLPNGLHYWLLNDSKAEKVELRLIVKTGFAYEPCGQKQIAHFVEHLPFTGTTHFPKPFEYFQNLGMLRGKDINATTEHLTTDFFLTIPAKKVSTLQDAMEFLNDCIHHITFDSLKIENEKGVVLNEVRASSSDISRIEAVIQYGTGCGQVDQSLDETRESVLGLTILKLKKFYHSWYKPGNCELIVVGNFDLGKTEESIKRIFSREKANPVISPEPCKTNADANCRELIFESSELFDSRLKTYFPVRRNRHDLPSSYRQTVLTRLFNFLLEARLSKMPRQPDSGSVAGASFQGDVVAFGTRFDGLIVTSSFAPGEVRKGYQSVISFVQSIIQQGFSEQEYAEALRKLNEYARLVLHPTITEQVASIRLAILNHLPAVSPESEFNLIRGVATNITRAEFNTHISTMLHADSLMVVLLQPMNSSFSHLSDSIAFWSKTTYKRSENLAPEANERKMIDVRRLSTSDTQSYKPNWKKYPTSVDGITKLILSNGIETYLKPMKASAQSSRQLFLHGVSPGGVSCFHGVDSVNALYSTNFIIDNGLGVLSSAEVRQFQTERNISVQPYIMNHSYNMFGSADPKDLEFVLALARLYFTDHQINSSRIENTKSRIVASERSQHNSSQSKLNAQKKAYLHATSAPSAGVKLTAADLDPMKSITILLNSLSDPANFKFVVTGDFAVDSAATLLDKYIGSLVPGDLHPSPCKHKPTADQDRNTSSMVNKTFYAGDVPDQALVEIGFSGNFDESPQTEVQLYALKFYLQERLGVLLREENGLTYSVFVDLGIDRFANRYNYSIQFICSPEGTNTAVSLTKQTLTSLKKTMISNEQLLQIKSLLLAKYKDETERPDFWSEYLADQILLNRPLGEMVDKQHCVTRLSKKQVLQACNTYLLTSSLQSYILMPADR